MGDMASVVRLLDEIKCQMAGMAGIKYQTIIVAAITALSAICGMLIQSWIQRSTTKFNSDAEFSRLTVKLRAETTRERNTAIQGTASKLLAKFDYVYNLISEQDSRPIIKDEINKLFYKIRKSTYFIGLKLNQNDTNEKAAYDLIKELYEITQEYALLYAIDGTTITAGTSQELDRLCGKYNVARTDLKAAVEAKYNQQQDQIVAKLSLVFNENRSKI